MNKMTPLAENLLKKSTGFRNKADLYQATRFLHEIGKYHIYYSLMKLEGYMFGLCPHAPFCLYLLSVGSISHTQ